MFNKKAMAVALIGLSTLPMLAYSVQNGSPQPNLYEFAGNNVHISYSTSGLDGQPHLVYKNGGKTLSFSGNQIRTVGTEIGTLVSVTTVMTVDTGSTSFSVLVPNVNLSETLESPIKTQGIVTKHKFSVIPSFNNGQVDSYKSVILTGTAKFVVF